MPGQGASLRYPFREQKGKWTLVTFEGPSPDNQTLLDVVWHHEEKPEHGQIPLSTLGLCMVPTTGLPTGRLLDVNHFEPSTPAPPQITRSRNGDQEIIAHEQLEFADWGFCRKCRRWRVVPREVWSRISKRGALFFCSDVLPSGCSAPRRKIEEEESWPCSS